MKQSTFDVRILMLMLMLIMVMERRARLPVHHPPMTSAMKMKLVKAIEIKKHRSMDLEGCDIMDGSSLWITKPLVSLVKKIIHIIKNHTKKKNNRTEIVCTNWR